MNNKTNSKNDITVKENFFKNGAIYFGCAGGFYFLYIADQSLKEQNLGQDDKRTGLPRYLCTNEQGYGTGNGQAFEDIYYQICKKRGEDIYKVSEMPNGVDFYVNGEAQQLKISRSPQALFRNLFDPETGAYRYPGQNIITTAELEAELRELINANKDRFNGENVIVNPAGTPSISNQEVYDQLYRGFPSLKNDVKDILQDKNSQILLLGGFISAFLGCIGVGAVMEYRADKSNAPSLKKMGRACNKSLRKHWKKGLLCSSMLTLICFGGHLWNRQLRRPVK